MSATLQGDWTKPAAMAIPKGGVFEGKVQQGRYGPIFPKTPACYGFTIIAKLIPGRESVFYEYAKKPREGGCRPARLPRRAQAALSPLADLPDQGGAPTSSIRASSTQTSTSTPRML